MVIEEPSVIAAASKGAKIARIKGGFEVSADESFSIGQIQMLDVDISSAISQIKNSSNEILQLANSKSNTLSKMGKGAKEVFCKEIDTPSGKMLIVELLIDVGDAMGANVTNTMCESVSPLIEKITGGRALLRILSNYSTRRLVKAKAVFEKEAVGGEKVVDNIISAFEFADNDVYRAVTHNKGVMNGTIAVANAVGQDSRAIEAAANAYAAKSGKYRSLSKWSKDNDGNLVGILEIPLSVGIVGGIANVHPVAKVCTKILGVLSAQELACVMTATGLAQNYSAIRALATEGIQKGHMRLHARNLAAAAGATPEQIDEIVQKMIEEKKISLDRAKELLEQI
jgi:hydroxymethylglutaryl-CoA reductase